LESFLAETQDQEIVSDFVNRIQGQNPNEKDKYSICEFLKDHNQNPDEFVSKKVSITEPEELKAQQIQSTVKNGNRPYIPGSSIKGAIRTALVYHEIKNSEKKLNDLKERINQRRAWNEVEKELDKIFGFYGDDVLKFLQVSDTSCFSETSIRIYHSKRVNIKSSVSSIPMNYEAIIPNLESVTFEIKTTVQDIHIKEYEKLDNGFLYLHKGNEQKLFPILNTFSENFINSEISAFQMIDSKDVVNHIEKFYFSALGEIPINKKREAIISLGRGKSFFNSTIDLLLDSDTLKTLRKNKNVGLSKRNRELVNPFPITRTVYYENGGIKGMFGWAKISMVENKK
jgi:CRISPR type III-A-associated RAMP protein Csm5